jgi:hypothetical protein
MLKYNQVIFNQLKSNNQDSEGTSTKFVQKKMENVCLLTNQMERGKCLNYMERQFQIMLDNMSPDGLVKMLEHNVLYFGNELQTVGIKDEASQYQNIARRSSRISDSNASSYSSLSQVSNEEK